MNQGKQVKGKKRQKTQGNKGGMGMIWFDLVRLDHLSPVVRLLLKELTETRLC